MFSNKKKSPKVSRLNLKQFPYKIPEIETQRTREKQLKTKRVIPLHRRVGSDANLNPKKKPQLKNKHFSPESFKKTNSRTSSRTPQTNWSSNKFLFTYDKLKGLCEPQVKFQEASNNPSEIAKFFEKKACLKIKTKKSKLLPAKKSKVQDLESLRLSPISFNSSKCVQSTPVSPLNKK